MYQTLGSHEELEHAPAAIGRKQVRGLSDRFGEHKSWGVGIRGTGHCSQGGVAGPEQSGPWRSDLCPKRTQSLYEQKAQGHTTQDGRAVVETRRPSSPLKATHSRRWLPQPFHYILANNNSNNS